MTAEQIQRTARETLGLLPGLLHELLPGGRVVGREYVCGDLTGGPGDSCKVNVSNGKWADFATGDTGGDPVSLLAAIRNCSQSDAAQELAERLGSRPPGPTPRRPSALSWRPILPVPADAPLPPAAHPQHGNPSMTWRYLSPGGDLLQLVYRFDTADGKQVLPLTYCTDGNRHAWRWQALPEQRPLYGLELLVENIRHAVVVEGEKAADAGRRLLGDKLPVFTWSGGSNAVPKTDWSQLVGKSVAIWPDADVPGIKAALAVADQLEKIGCTVKIVLPPEGVPQGWDLADAEAEGWTGEQVRGQLKAGLNPENFRATQAPYSTEGKPAQLTQATERSPILAMLRRGEDIKTLDIQVEYHLNPLVPKGAVILFFGRGGFGKSTLMIQIGGALASGLSIFGMQATPAIVVYVDFENSLAILSKRLHDVPADNVLFLDSTSDPPRLDRPGRNLYLDILAEHPGMVFIFDTLRSAQSSDENDSRAMADVMGFMRLLRDRGATVIVLHHTPKSSDRKYKGSGAIFDMADHILGLYPVKQAGDDTEADDDEDEARVFRFGTCMKTRFEPSRMFLTFNAESRRFEVAPDPTEQELTDMAAIIRNIGMDAKQGDILSAAHDEGLSQKKALALLAKGEGRLWNKRRGMNNSKLYSLTESGFSVLLPYIGPQNRQTETGFSCSSEKPGTGHAQQNRLDTGFVGILAGEEKPGKPTDPVDAPDFDF